MYPTRGISRGKIIERGVLIEGDRVIENPGVFLLTEQATEDHNP